MRGGERQLDGRYGSKLKMIVEFLIEAWMFDWGKVQGDGLDRKRSQVVDERGWCRSLMWRYIARSFKDVVCATLAVDLAMEAVRE